MTDDTEAWAHRRIARALADMAAGSLSEASPHPYIRRHLARHAAAGDVLDDVHLAPEFLPWESGAVVRGLMGLPVTGSSHTRALSAWASIEPFAGDADHRSRASSLHLALFSGGRDGGHPMQAVPGSLVRPLWSDWELPANVVARTAATVRGLARVPVPGGRWLLAAGDAEGAVRLWDPVTGAAVGGPMTGHGGGVDALVALTPPGGSVLLASAGRDHTVRMWDPMTGAEVRELAGHDEWVNALTVLPRADGFPLLASGDGEGTIRVWDPATGVEEAVIWSAHAAQVRALTAVTTERGRSLLVSAGHDGAVRLWDPPTDAPVRELRGGDDRINVLAAFTGSDGRAWVAAGDGEGVLRLWDLDRSDVPKVLGAHEGNDGQEGHQAHTGQINTLSGFEGADGRFLLAAGDATGVIRVWDPATATARHARSGHQGAVTAMAVLTGSRNRQLLATAGDDQTLRLWDPAAFVDAPGPHSWRRDRTQTLVTVISADGPPTAVLADRDGVVEARDARLGAVTSRWGDQVRVPVTAATAVAAGRRLLLVAASADCRVRFTVATTGRETTVPLALVTEPGTTVTASAAFAAADGSPRCALAVNDGTVHVCDPLGGAAYQYPSGHLAAVTHMTVFPGRGRRPRLVTAGRDGLVLVRDALTGSDAGKRMAGHKGAVNEVAVFRDGRARTVLATAGSDGTVRLWDASTGAEEGVITSHGGEVSGVVAFTDARQRPLLATAGDDCVVRVWNPGTGECVLSVVCGAPVRITGIPNGVRPALLLSGPAGYLCFEIAAEAL
ncbi:WD40 repeat domain-containing protein [Streptomyces sp. NPDC001815]|uniref:WD40 repeat domain-containing protein n=1 Tax=Streptomyces sp. NPDC001815 TaxID=3154526 RepID=UPI003320E5F4